ncbi:MAG: MarR family winged helix-turn-helix transcriptional regulator [Bryobacteraceae bacterium]
MARPTEKDYRALAEFRYRVRQFLRASEKAARSTGLEPEQYQLLLAVHGMPNGREATMRELAERLCVRHNTAVERVDRLARLGFVRRARSHTDARAVLIHLTARGARLVERLATKHLVELCQSGPALIRALAGVIAATRHPRRNIGHPRSKK